MEEQTFLWTVLPKARIKPILPVPDPIGGVIPGGIPGVDQLLRGRLRMSVLVSPRLGFSGSPPGPLTLDRYLDLREWPSTLMRDDDDSLISFDVVFDGVDEPIAATVVDMPPRQQMLTTWRAMFPATATTVTPFELDGLVEAETSSVELAAVADFLRGVYVLVGTDPQFGAGETKPSPAALAQPGVLGQLADIKTEKEPPTNPPVFVEIALDLTVGPDGVEIGVKPGSVPTGPPPIEVPIPVPDTLDPVLRRRLSWKAVRSAYKDLRLFHTPQPPPPLPQPGTKSLYDFHEMVAATGPHPALLRRLGLLFDVEVGIPPGLPSSSRLRLVPSWRPQLGRTVNLSPWTAYVTDVDRFVTRPRDDQPEIRSQRLRLDDMTRFRVEQIDTDGGGAAALALADNLVQKSESMPESVGLPSLRSGGVVVIRRQADVDLKGSWTKAMAANQKVPPAAGAQAGDPVQVLDVTQFAEDLTPGYRVDVFDEKTRAWRSLCARTVAYRFKLDPAADFTVTPDGRDDRQEFLEGYAEVAVAQDGDTTKARVPGALFVWDGWGLCAPRPGLVAPNSGAAPKPVEVGNEGVMDFGPVIRSTAIEGSLPRLRFGRTYRVRARAVDVAGNSLPLTDDLPLAVPEATAPITYTRFEPVASPAVVLADAGPAGAGPGAGESVERLVVRSDPLHPDNPIGRVVAVRHVAPPKTSVAMAEAHGVLDALMKAPNQAGHDRLARESGSFADGGTFVGPPQDKQYLVRPEAQLKVPYLPDPFARAALVLGLPGVAPGTVTPFVNRVPFDGPWPDTLPFRLELAGIKEEAAPKAPLFDRTRRALRVEIRESEAVLVRLSTAMNPADLQVMGLTQWVKDKAPDQLPTYTARALQGKNWLLMPYRELVLVHAVQRPVKPPLVSELRAAKAAFGQTFARVECRFDVHRRSTSKVELLAAWTDPVDDVNVERPGTVDRVAQLGKVDVPVPLPVAFGETDGTQVQVPLLLRLVAKNEFADTKHHLVRYHASATTSFRDYFDPGLTAADLSRDGPDFVPPGATGPKPAEIDIPSSARPDAPKVLYAVPTFRWDRSPQVQGDFAIIIRDNGDGGVGPVTVGPERIEPGQARSVRTGKGLRVYVERPWFSSGEGELLGVVFVANPVLDDGDPRKPYVTGWGADPLWDSPAPTPTLSAVNFPAAVRVESGLTLEELPDLAPAQRVSVAGHEPEYDKARQLWFFDIELDLGNAYFPFVRLALARYQPSSLVVGGKDVKVSRVVQLDFVQIAPDRTLTLRSTPGTTPGPVHTVAIEVHGFTGVGAAAGGGTPVKGTSMLALLQTPNSAFPDEAGWQTQSVTELAVTVDAARGRVWRGVVTFPEDDVSRRLVVGEVEFMDKSGLKIVDGGKGLDLLEPPGARFTYLETLRLARLPLIRPDGSLPPLLGPK